MKYECPDFNPVCICYQLVREFIAVEKESDDQA